MSASRESTGGAGARRVRSDGSYRGRQGLEYRTGITTATAGSRNVCMVVAEMPPGARARAHLHRGIETAIYVIEGEVETHFGAALGERVATRAGDYLYIDPDTPHVVVNRSDRVCRAVIVHTAGDDQEGIVMLPELDARVP